MSTLGSVSVPFQRRRHPHNLLEKVELVKEIIVRLADALQDEQKTNPLIWEPTPIQQFWRKDSTSQSVGAAYEIEDGWVITFR
jgi:hypothetical protein